MFRKFFLLHAENTAGLYRILLTHPLLFSNGHALGMKIAHHYGELQGTNGGDFPNHFAVAEPRGEWGD